MHPRDQNDIEEIFCDALKVTNPIQRRIFLDRACGRNSSARERIESLLAVQAKAELFFARNAVELTLADSFQQYQEVQPVTGLHAH